MADRNTSQQQAALDLLHLIAWAEGKETNMSTGNANAPSREWLLSTYAQCLHTVMKPEYVNQALKFPIPDKSDN